MMGLYKKCFMKKELIDGKIVCSVGGGGLLLYV